MKYKMNKRNLFIHVGYPKTGTTTLQKHFFPKLEEFQYIGKHDDGGKLFDFDLSIVNNLIFKPDLNKNSFSKEVFKKNKILLSEESFIFNSLRASNINGETKIPRPIDIASNIRRLFNHKLYNVKILFTIRRQDQMVTSLYSQSYLHYYSKYGDTDTFQKYLNIYINHEHNSHIYFNTLDYLQTINDYMGVFGENNVSVLVFEELQENSSLFYEKLCDFLDVDFIKYGEIAINKNENKRLTNAGYKKTKHISLFDKLVLIKQRHLSFVKFRLSNEFKEKLKKIVWNSNEKISKTIFLTKDESKKVLKRYKNSNKTLSEKLKLNLHKYGYYND